VEIHLEDVVGEQATADVTYLGEHLVRFRFPRDRGPSASHRLLLEGGGDASCILPDAPNRAAVEHNLAQLRQELAQVFERDRSCRLLRAAGVDSAASFLRLNVEHFCRPTWLYTNGQSLVSLVAAGRHAFDAVPHPDVARYLAFVSDWGGWPVLSARGGRRLASLAAAEIWVGERLSELKMRPVPLARGRETRTLLLQPAGEVPSGHGRVSTFIAHHGPGPQRLRVGAGELEGFLVAFDADGFRPRVCATCTRYQPSGMSRDMSGGTAGYCEAREQEARESGLPQAGLETDPPFHALVSILDSCADHDLRKP
jgi:hypothetical protein